MRAANVSMIPQNYIERVIELAGQGVTEIKFDEYNTDWTSEAYITVSGQNSNNSVRVPNAFMQALLSDGEWPVFWRTEKAKAAKENRAPRPWKTIIRCAWASSPA